MPRGVFKVLVAIFYFVFFFSCGRKSGGAKRPPPIGARVNTRQAGSPKLHRTAVGLSRPLPLLTWLLGIGGRNGKKTCKSSPKTISKLLHLFFVQINIVVTKGHQMSDLAKCHITSEMVIIQKLL